MKTLIYKCDKCGTQMEMKDQVSIVINHGWEIKPIDLCKECAEPYLLILSELPLRSANPNKEINILINPSANPDSCAIADSIMKKIRAASTKI
jgi:hypothetical protein